MKVLSILLVAVVGSGCGGVKDEGPSEYVGQVCDGDFLEGHYTVSYKNLGGNCGSIPDQQIYVSVQQFNSTCEVMMGEMDPEACESDLTAHCSEMEDNIYGVSRVDTFFSCTYQYATHNDDFLSDTGRCAMNIEVWAYNEYNDVWMLEGECNGLYDLDYAYHLK